jgi:hypothetical protein
MIRTNVVRIDAQPEVDKRVPGFGFIVGEDAGQLYIVTANHVVREEDSGKSDSRPAVSFFSDSNKKYSSVLLSTYLTSSQGDVAVLRVAKPQGLNWKRDVEATSDTKRDSEVWFVGRLTEWYVPTRAGQVNQVDNSGQIAVDDLHVLPGTSGAPLISRDGIVGMVVVDGPDGARATPMRVIQTAFERWNYPWKLGSLQPQETAQAKPGMEGESKSQTVQAPIAIWKVGSPHTGATPDTTNPMDLDLASSKMGRTLSVQAFPAKGFATTFFDAFKKGDEPDILAIDNYGLIDGITTDLGNFTGIGSSQTVRQQLVSVTDSLTELETGGRGGWEFLVSGSKNHEAARQLALRSPTCETSWQGRALPDDLRKIATRIAWIYLQQSESALKPYDDLNRLHTDLAAQRRIQVAETKECGYWGNERLAIVPLVFSYDSPQAIGRISVVLIMRKQGDAWRLLMASTDPVTVKSFLQSSSRLESLIQKPWVPKRSLAPATLLQPPDGTFPQPLAGQRFGDFMWQPSKSAGIVAEIIEFAYKGSARLFIRFRSANDSADERISTGSLWTTHSDWKWRVWSVADDGALSFSAVRSFPG